MDHVDCLMANTIAEPVVERNQGSAFLYARRRLHNALALAAGDALALGTALLAAGVLRTWLLGDPLIPAWSWLIIPVWWCGATLMRLLPSWGLGPVEELRRITLLLFFVSATAITLLFLSKQTEGVSRFTLTLALLFSFLTIPLMRVRIKRLLVAWGKWGVPVVIYGAGQTGSKVVKLLQTEQGLAYNPIALFDDNPLFHGTSLENVSVVGGTDLVSMKAPVAIMAMPGISRVRLIELLEGPLSCYRTVLVIPDLFEVPSLWVKPRDLNGILGLEITSNLLNPIAQFVKRASDIVLILASAPFWFPLCALLALLIWQEDRSLPFFSQERIGKDGHIFKVWKFRTMLPNAEEILRQRLEEDEELRNEWETFYKLREDPRVTSVGAFLRRFSLDELPQLINVLRGEMSLIGPRPLPPYHHYELPARVRNLRERVAPGMTGLWQVSGRSDAGTEGMVHWDPYYVRNWSLWLDAVVLIRTVRAILEGSGAY